MGLRTLAHQTLGSFWHVPDQLVRLFEGQPRSSRMIRLSKLLLDMLHCNVDRYKVAEHCGFWADTSHLIASKPFLVAASAVPPYEVTPALTLVSLQDSEDHSHHRLVANAVAVTELALGDTTKLRTLLGLPEGPQIQHVIAHLMHTAKTRNAQLESQQNPPAISEAVQADVTAAHAFIVAKLDSCLGLDRRRELMKLARKLMSAPWVMVQRAQRFVVPCDLVFDIDEDLDHGMYCF